MSGLAYGHVAVGALELALLLTAGLVVGRGLARTWIAVGLAAVCVALPLALPATPAWPRCVLGLASLFAILRTIEVLGDARAHRATLRMFAFVAPLDAFAVTRAAPRFDGRGFAVAAGYGIVATLGFAIVLHAPMGVARWPVAALGCAIGVYGAMDGMSALNRGLLRAIGIESPPVQNAPIRARSVGEFWSLRWNRAVGGWLRRHCFLPLARRGRARAGSVLAFAASALLHFWPVLLAVGLAPALAMAGFFAVQAALATIETRLGVARWPRAAAHAWTVTVLLASSPLFTVPALLVLGFR